MNNKNLAKAPRVLHCVERLHKNAIESWLVRMLLHAKQDGTSLSWSFHVHQNEIGNLEDRIKYCENTNIFRSPVTLSQPLLFMIHFYRLCRRERFDVVHIHADIVSSLYLIPAKLARVPKIFVHVHNADLECLTPNPLKAFVFTNLSRFICYYLSNKIIGISSHTLATFLGKYPSRNDRHLVHYYGVDSLPFRVSTLSRTAFRSSLGCASDALILLFAGRIEPEKNPIFVIDILSKLVDTDPRFVAVFAGAGSLSVEVMERAVELGIAQHVYMINWRSDLPIVMTASDLFVLPRPEYPMEGFGLAVVEAQLAGLRLLLSQGIPDEPLLPSATFCRLSTVESAQTWALAAIDLLNQPACSRDTAHSELAASPMAMDHAMTHLLALYS